MLRPVWIVCPVYLDTESFLCLREDARKALGRSIRFVIIDDTAGRDPDLSSVTGLSDVRVITPPFNLGHQRALTYALRTLSSELSDDDIVITMDSDGEDKPSDLPALIAPLEAAPNDLRAISIARRTRRRESTVFKLMYFFFKIFFRVLTGMVIRSGNFAAYRGWVVRNVIFHPHFDLCYSSALLSLDVPIRPVPCERGRRYAGRSRMNYTKLIMHGIQMLMPFMDRIAIRAMIGGATGAGLSLGAFGAAMLAGASEVIVPAWIPATAVLVGVVCLGILAIFVVLFTIFSQSRGLAMRGMENSRYGSPRETSRQAA